MIHELPHKIMNSFFIQVSPCVSSSDFSKQVLQFFCLQVCQRFDLVFSPLLFIHIVMLYSGESYGGASYNIKTETISCFY
jgi:hypothetical protein